MKLGYESIKVNVNWDTGFDIMELGKTTLIAEINHFKDFSSGENRASWLGVTPNIYKSADKFYSAESQSDYQK